MISTDELTDVFVKLADTLVADFDLVEFLYNLSESSAKICRAEAVGIMITDQQGVLQYIAASTEQARLIELFQIQNAEGPCLDCFVQGKTVVNLELSQATERWPAFAPRAVKAGFSSVHAIPMRLRSEIIGALNIFGSPTHTFEPADVRVVQALADVATIAILQARSIKRVESLAEHLQGALSSRVTLEQAKGALSRLRGVDPDQAFVLMRSYARTNRLRLSDVATAVMTEPDSVSSLTSHS